MNGAAVKPDLPSRSKAIQRLIDSVAERWHRRKPAMSDTPVPELQTKPCIACKQEIPVGASLCSVCKSYQRPWKNRLQFFGPLVAGLVAVILLSINGVAWFWGTGRIYLGFGSDDVL
jgi:hypothetical protein